MPFSVSCLVNRGRHPFVLAEVDEHLGAYGGVFHNLSRAAPMVIVGTGRRGPWTLQRRFDHETRSRGEEVSLRLTLIRKSDHVESSE